MVSGIFQAYHRHMNVTTLDDISAVIGYTATRKLQSWYGGKWLQIPVEVRPDHALSRILGEPALRALHRSFRVEGGCDRIWVPSDFEGAQYDRRVRVAKALVSGEEIRAIAAMVGLRESAVETIRRDLLREGWIRWEMAAPRRYVMTTGQRGRPRRKILGTGEVFD